MYPVLFRLGPLDVESFWVMLFLGFVVAGVTARAELRRHGMNPQVVYDLLLYAYVGGLIGARLFLLFTAWDHFVRDPFTFLLSGSGWVWYGGLIGGTAAVVWGARRDGIPIPVVADAAGPALAIGHAVGRIGCQLAGDGDYGVPTTLPWGMSYPNGTVPTTDIVHPTPVYETILYAAIFLYLWRLRGKRPAGEAFGRYLALSGTARFLVEFVRANIHFALGLTLQQWISMGTVIAGIGVVVALNKARGLAPSPDLSLADRNL